MNSLTLSTVFFTRKHLERQVVPNAAFTNMGMRACPSLGIGVCLNNDIPSFRRISVANRKQIPYLVHLCTYY